MTKKTVNKTLIDQEHSEIEQLAATLYRTFAERNELQKRVVGLLSMLRERVCAHLKDESPGGYLEEQTRDSSELTEKRETLCADHGRLNAHFDRIIALADEGLMQTGWWDELESKFHELGVEIDQHESREQELLRGLPKDPP